jgi:TRAP-type C4-dicarboxylate transport system permease small subunit
MDSHETDAAIEGTETELPPVDLPAVWLPFDNGVLAATKAVVIVIGLAFTVLVSSEVVSRFLIGQSISWVNGTARFLLVWFFMIGASLALRQGGHVALDILGKMLPPLPQTIVYYLAQILTVTFLLELRWSGVSALEGSFPQTEGSLGISMAWVMSAFPVGFGLLIYHQIVLVLSATRQLASKAGRK